MGKFDLTNTFTNFLGDGDDTGVQQIPLDDLVPWVGKDGRLQPFRVRPEELPQLVESIQAIGVLSPIVVRPKGDEYEILSGHRRTEAAKLAGLTTVPVVIRDVSDDEAVCILCDSNLNHRDKLLPSEKAFAYKLKLDAIKRQGNREDLTCGQVVHKLEGAKSRDVIAEQSNENARQISRYVRLTELLPDLLDLVDGGKLAFIPAVTVSYLKPDEQQILLDVLKRDQISISLSQATQLKELSGSNKLTVQGIEQIMTIQKPESKQVTLKGTKIEKYFPKNTSKEDMEKIILQLLEKWQKEKSNKEKEAVL
jgi:ParB family chromosome partitioning protein